MISHLKTCVHHPDLYGLATPLVLVNFFEARLLEMLQGDNYFSLSERYAIHYGDTLSGRDWERVDKGYLELCSDPLGFMLMHNSRSQSGPLVMLNNIVKITLTSGNVTLYRHPLYHLPSEDPPKPAAQEAGGRNFRRVKIRRTVDG